MADDEDDVLATTDPMIPPEDMPPGESDPGVPLPGKTPAKRPQPQPQPPPPPPPAVLRPPTVLSTNIPANTANTTTTSSSSSPNSNTSTTHVKVGVRVRPLTPREEGEGGGSVVNGTANPPEIQLGKRRFTYDSVFDTSVSQQYLYQSVAPPLLKSFLEGFNATVCLSSCSRGKGMRCFGNTFFLLLLVVLSHVVVVVVVAFDGCHPHAARF